MFWRIPADLTTDELRTIVRGLELNDDAELVNPDALNQIRPKNQTNSSASSKKKKQKKKARQDKTDKKDKRQRKEKKKNEQRKREEKKRREKEKKDDRIHDIRDEESDESDEDDVADVNGANSEGESGEGDSGKGSKMTTAAQRRKAMQSMLARRKGKKGGDRETTGSGYVITCNLLIFSLPILKDIDSLEAMGLGANRFCNYDLGLKWVNQIKILGVYFGSTKSSSEIDLNWTTKIQQIKHNISLWEKRNLGLLGKICIIKSLLLSQFIYTMQAISLPEKALAEVNTILYRFLWRKKNCKIVTSDFFICSKSQYISPCNDLDL